MVVRKTDEYIKDKIEEGKLSKASQILPRKFIKLSKEDWDNIDKLVEEEREAQMQKLADVKKRLFGMFKEKKKEMTPEE